MNDVYPFGTVLLVAACGLIGFIVGSVFGLVGVLIYGLVLLAINVALCLWIRG